MDPETGLQLNRNRFYAAGLGRWVNRDPIGYDGGGMNVYEYVNGMAISSLDPTGLYVPPDWPGRVQGCFTLLRAAVTGGILTGRPCAAELLRLFLNANMKNRVACPKACRDALNDPKLDIGQIVVDQFPTSVPFGSCNSSGTEKFQDDVDVPYNFSGASDLAFAFGNVHLFGKNGQCTWECGEATKPRPINECCCDCKATCGFELTLGDTYDFCSSLKPTGPPSLKRDFFDCGCIIETWRRSNGRHPNIFTIACPLGDKQGQFSFTKCEKQ